MDKTTKLLLAAIAAGLWFNICLTLFGPISATAQSGELSTISSNVSSLERIATGTCTNSKIC